MRIYRLLTFVFCLPLLAARSHEARFVHGQSALCIPFDNSNHHIAVKGALNGRDGMTLVLDTGAGGSVIDAARAEALGLAAVGRHVTHGAGGAEEASTVYGVSVELPGLELTDLTMNTLPLEAIAAQGGKPMDGILGRPLLDRCVVEVDYPRRCLSFFDPEDYPGPRAGDEIPLSFKESLPYVKARIVLPDGRPISGKFVVDTGASTSVILNPTAIEREGVDASLAKTITVQARGVGGAREIRLTRMGRLDLGRFSLAQPIVALQPPGPGYISAPGTIGNIGGGILSRFKVTFDYRRHRMILEPGPDIDRPFEADMSGLSLVSMAPDFKRVKVSRVLDGSPALEAGIQAGDELATVDGKPAGEIGLSTLREQLKQENQDLKLTLVRGGETLSFQLKTRRMI